MSVGFEDLTVGIVTYRRPEAVAETLRTLDDVPNVNVVINGSTMDEYREVVEGFSDRVRFSQNIRNLGVAATGNRLVIESNTRFVIWATDSCEFQPGWWQHVLELLNSDSPPQHICLSSPKRWVAMFVDKASIAAQGFYDHNFTQVYYEDEDMYLRTLEHLGLNDQDVALTDVMPRLNVVASRWSSKKSWNSIPNRTYFWKKWQRVDRETPGRLQLREDIAVKRNLPEPSFPFLALVQERYRRGDFASVPFVYDPPSKQQVRLTKLTSNPVVARARYVVSRMTNRSGKLK